MGLSRDGRCIVGVVKDGVVRSGSCDSEGVGREESSGDVLLSLNIGCDDSIKREGLIRVWR